MNETALRLLRELELLEAHHERYAALSRVIAHAEGRADEHKEQWERLVRAGE